MSDFYGWPQPFRPVASRAGPMTTRPPSRTFKHQRVRDQERVQAGIRGQVRKSATWASSSAAIVETCDVDNPLMPRVSTSFSIRRVDTPSRQQVATTVVNA